MQTPRLRKRRLALACLIGLVRAAAAQAQGVNQVVYDDALKNGWVNYSWATVSFSNTSPVHSGSDSISVNSGANQALYLHNSGIPQGAFSGLTFWLHGGAAGGQTLELQATVNGNEQPAVPLAAPTANTWKQVTVTLAQLGVANTAGFDGFWIKNTGGAVLPVYYVDDIALLAAPPPNPIILGVNAGSATRAVDGRIFGLNTAVWDGQLTTAATATLLGAIQTKALRYPGGSTSDAYSWQTDRSVAPSNSSFTWAGSFSSFAQLAGTVGAQAYLTVNYGSGTPQEAAAWVAYANGSASNTAALGIDAKGVNWQTAGYWAAMRGAAPLANDDGYNFLRVSHPAPYAFKYWEVGNENYGNWERDDHGASGSGLTGAANDPLTYAQYFASFAQQMRAVDATIKVGAVAAEGEDSYGNGKNGAPNPDESNSVHTGWTPVMLHNMAALGVTPDFLIYHDYPQGPGSENDAFLLQAGASIGTYAANLRGMINSYFGRAAGAGIELTMTELNSVSYNVGKQTTSLVNGLYMADALGWLAQTEFNDCEWWDLRNGSDAGNNNSASLYGWRQFGDYGLLAGGDRSDTPANTPYPSYYAAKLLTHWAAGGDSVVSGTSNYSLLSVHPILRAGGSLALLVINKSPDTDLTGQVTLTGFTPSSATAAWYRYGKPEDLANGDLSSGTIANAAATFSTTFPSYSMTVLTLAPQTPSGAQTAAATNASATSATLNGSVNPSGSDTTVTFQYGLTPSYGQATAGADAGSGNAPVPVSISVSGLTPGALYHYRLAATNAGGTAYGPDQTFSSPAAVPAVPRWAAPVIALCLFAAAASLIRRRNPPSPTHIP